MTGRRRASRVGHNDEANSNLTETAFSLNAQGGPLSLLISTNPFYFLALVSPGRVGTRLAINAAPWSLSTSHVLSKSQRNSGRTGSGDVTGNEDWNYNEETEIRAHRNLVHRISFAGLRVCGPGFQPTHRGPVKGIGPVGRPAQLARPGLSESRKVCDRPDAAGATRQTRAGPGP